MKLNDAKFPNYLEVQKKFDLEHNKELAEYIDYMYKTYLDLYEATYRMPPERIRNLNEFYYYLPQIYSKELPPTWEGYREFEKAFEIFKEDPDKQAVVQKLYDIYMKKCSDEFKYKIESLFEEK